MEEASVGWLMEHLGITGRAIGNSFEARFRVQKAAFLLKCLGVRPFSEYGFGLYIHGPYSTTVAKGYYSARPGSRANLSPDTIEKLDWFANHSDRWIELASAILSLKDSNRGIGDEDLFSTLRMSKPWVKGDEFGGILRELGSQGLVR